MSKISIIVPVYNVEEYLPQCLDSIIAQTFKDIEIICVNDVSPDNSHEILKEYAKKDSRIKIVNHEINQGLGPARNTGVSHSTSPYIAFIDSDDYIALTMMEKLIDSMESNSADLSWCATAKVTEKGYILDTGEIPVGIWSPEEIFNDEKFYPSIQTVTNKLFRRDLIKNIEQLPIRHEDEPTIAQYLPKCSVIVTINSPEYYYRITTSSLSNPSSHTQDFWENYFYAYSLYFRILQKNNVEPDAIRKQLVLRCSALLWRIKTYNLLQSDSWEQQSDTIIKLLKNETLPFKKYCPLLQKYLLFTLSIKSFPKIQKEFISTGLTLSRRVWPKRCSYKTIFFDILMVEIPKIKHLIKKLLDKFEIKLFSILAHLLNLINRNSIWLVGEREDTAQENGLYFYKYLNRNKKNELAYYIINKKCDQYKSVKNVGKIVQFNSFKHKLLFCASTYYATSHNHYCIPKTKFRNTRYSLHKGLKNIFLDHGITYADVSEFYGKQNSGIDLFICGAKPEEDYVLDKFGYKLNEVAYTGFARFDGLHNFKTKKQILVMPTWRRDIYNLKNHFENEKELFFKNSLYYKVFQSLFTNVNLLELLEEYSYQLVFYPHYEIQDYLKHFTTTHDSIKIASKDDYIVQDLLKSASLLITDTSSVHFDFAYMYKPVIYYKFDKDTFTNTHLPEGYFKHEKMGFGEVIVEEERLINLIKKHLQNDCKMDEQYRNRVKDFYPLYDANNCERIYNSIVDNYE